MAFLKNLKQECVLARGAWIGLLCAAAGAYVQIGRASCRERV